jgi:hypothetical protein
MKIRSLPEAEADLARAADFYDAQAGGLGHYFIECLAVLDCRQDPEAIESRLCN